MSFLLQHAERPPKRRRKHDGVHLKKNEATKNALNSYESLVVVGYQCKIFRDDEVAEYIEDGKHLITWMGDDSLLVDRYDCRGYFYSQDDFGLPSSGTNEISSDDKHMEEECDKYRYFELNVNEEEHSVVKEESDEWETPQISSSAYSSIGYEYQERHSKTVDGDKEYDPNECFDYDDSYQGNEIRKPLSAPSRQAQLSYVPKHSDNYLQLMYKKPDGLDIPEGMNVPDSQKSHSIIEKTAAFISKHGTQMEIILKAKQAGNPQFDFLNFGNWLNPYYKLILGKIKDGTYKVHQTSAGNNDSDEAEDSKSESGSDSSDEYVHPLLQAHRRPVKTRAEISVDNGQKGNVDSSALEKDMRDSSSILPYKLHASAAEVYMARKYEHLRKDLVKKGLETMDATKNADNDDWADHLEEAIDQSGVQFSYEMLQYMCPPPPPPPSSVSSSTSDLNRSHHVASPHNSFPSQPPPPGDTFSSVEKPFVSNSDDDPQQQQHQQQYLDHIVPPPPDLKSVVDKLAEYVARNGEVFEEQIKHKNDPRFEFLSANNIYFPYYLYRKQQSIMKVQSITASKNDDKREKAGKPLSFALKKKSQKSNESKLKSVEIFKCSHDDGGSDVDDETIDSLDGYRPNTVKKQSKRIDENMEEKAKETMEKAKIMIAEAQKKQRKLQQERDSVEQEVQMERRRKAAAFIGMLKNVKNRETSSSSSESSSDEEGTHRSEEDENALPRRHFKESKEDDL